MSIINIYHGDSIKAMESMSDRKYNLAICDPPYFNGPEKRKYYGRAISTHGVKRKEYKPLVGSWEIPSIKYYNGLIKISKHQIIWGINYFEFISKVSPGRIIWDKVNDGSTFSNCEIASCSINEIKIDQYRFMWRGMMQGSPDDGRKMNGNKSENETKIHPTQKPIALYKWLLKNYAKPGDKIFDSHGGSMSHAIACIEMGFDLDIWELDKDYYNSAVKRIKQHVKQLDAFRPVPEINYITH